MPKKEFLEVKKNYEEARKRFLNINVGDLVWRDEHVPFYTEYYDAIVQKVNVDKNCVEVLNVSTEPHEHRKYNAYDFATEEEFLETGDVTKEDIERFREKHSGLIEIIKKVY